MKHETGTGRLERLVASRLRRMVRTRADCGGASVALRSDQAECDVLVRASESYPDAFHAASVGKLFTAALVGRMVDDGVLRFDDRVASLLAPGTLDGLFHHGGVDHQHEVTVAHLMSHTSGAADYFADPARDGRTVSHLIVDQPDRRWSPHDLLDFSREQNSAGASPGERFHYSDTGYALLGLVIESILGVDLHDALHRHIFEPLGMNRTFVPFRSAPANGTTNLRPAYLHGVDVSLSPSLTADWAGGGVASTEGDLIRFQRALRAGALVSEATLARMERFEYVFRRGIHYGLGFMQYHFGEWFPLLRRYPKVRGHMGILGTHLCYDPQRDLHIVISMGSDAAPAASVRLLIAVVGLVRRAIPARGGAR